MTSEFQEIGHCGGQFTVKVSTVEGQRGIQLGMRGCRPTPMSVFGIYALPQGIPVGPLEIGGMGVPFNPAPTADSLSIFIASDSEGLFGHRCPECGGYWRSNSAATAWPITCVYCGLRADIHNFLTEGQRKYVQGCCELITDAMASDSDGEFVIDMDQVADAVGKDTEKPPFYYAEVSQQNKFNCEACGGFNDILGRYGYCACCGTHNGLAELKRDIHGINARIQNGTEYENCARDTVAAYDSFARQFSRQFAARIPMVPARQKDWGRKLFHQLKSCAESLQSVFGINLFNNLKQDEIDFAIRMFHRRHVYEHNGGEADQKYIDDSGDTSVRAKQALHETQESASRIANVIVKIGQNFHEGFHLIFPPEEKAIQTLSRPQTFNKRPNDPNLAA